jgi:hypothetical protein
LGRLAAYIAVDLKAAIQSNGVQASVHLESLGEWHRTLPPPMQLSRLSIADPYDLDWHSKRSLLQLHIIFLGLFIEPYRDGLVDLARSRLGDATLNPEDFEALHHLEEQCILAARQSARVTSLLQINDLIRSHCWVAMYVCSKRSIQQLTQGHGCSYTSFTGCATLIFAASQKLLQLFGEEAGQDLSYAALHLSALSYCSFDNTMAKKLHSQLLIMFNDIREVIMSPVYRAMLGRGITIEGRAVGSFSHYNTAEGAEEMSRAILEISRNSMALLQDPGVFREQ